MTGHVFISYARRDGSEHARKFDKTLSEHGFKTWYDKRGIDPTQDFTAEIETAIEAASYVVTCITPDVKREDSFVRREIGYAQAVKKPILVARFADIVPPIPVITNTWLDFFRGWDESFMALCKLLEQAPGNYTPPPPADDTLIDPYKPYLQALYKQIVGYLDKTIISTLPGETKAAELVLRSDATPDAVNPPEAIEAQALPMAFFDMAGIVEQKPSSYGNFREAFEQHEGRILLLGDPGAGKTTTLMAFARDQVAARLDNVSLPLPILAPIVSWDVYKRPSLSEWLSNSVPALKNDVSRLIMEGKTMLLLDGLDELGDKRPVDPNKPDGDTFDPRPQFMHVIPDNNQVIVTCRVKDYGEIGEKLALKGAVTLQALDDAQMQAYLYDLPELWDVLKRDDELREVARTPLLLSLFAYAFAGLGKEAKVLHNISQGDLRDKIFETYVQRRYEWEEHKAENQGKKLQFPFRPLVDLLGGLAMKNVRDRDNNSRDNILRRYQFKALLLPQEVAIFLEFVTKLRFLVQTEDDEFSFIHLLLRDYFAFSHAVRQLSSNPWRQRASAAATLGKLKDERAIEYLGQTSQSND